jgi:hypothetical protein
MSFGKGKKGKDLSTLRLVPLEEQKVDFAVSAIAQQIQSGSDESTKMTDSIEVTSTKE